MEYPGVSRRDFILRTSFGVSAAWLAANWPAILSAQEHMHRAAKSGAPLKFTYFMPEQAAEVEAIAAQIIPSDDGPGAREAGVVYFMDHMMAQPESEPAKNFPAELAKFQQKVAAKFPGVTKFSALSSDQQIAFLKANEEDPFFQQVRGGTIAGFLCDPSRGGNRGEVGWKHIGFDAQFQHQPPFGFYDREYAEQAGRNPGGKP